MKLEKLKLKRFEQNVLSFSSLKSIAGGKETTTCGKKVCDLIDDIGNTHFDSDDDVYDDNVCDA